MRARHYIVTLIGAVSGVCFAVLAARCLAVVVARSNFWVSALLYAVVTGALAYFAFRAAIAGRTDEASFLHGLWGGLAGAVAGVLIVGAGYAMFRDSVRTYVARPLGLHLSQVSMFRILLALLLLGFAAGFALSTSTQRKDEEEGAEGE